VKCGKKVCFHGSFARKEDAKRKELEVRGFIREIEVRGHKRYVVMTGKPSGKYKKQLHSDDNFLSRLFR